MANVLIVEDEVLVAKSLQRYLQKTFTNVFLACTYEKGLELALSDMPDILCVDVTLSEDKTGLDLARAVREIRKDLPILVITGTPLEEHFEETFELGLTDYIAKPYHPEEIRVRVTNLLKLQKLFLKQQSAPDTLEHIKEDFTICHDTSKIVISGEEKHLPKTLKYLLDLFLLHRNKILSHQFLQEKIWGDYYDIEKKREIRAHTKRLRHILGPKYGPLLVNVKAQGYMLQI